MNKCNSCLLCIILRDKYICIPHASNEFFEVMSRYFTISPLWVR